MAPMERTLEGGDVVQLGPGVGPIFALSYMTITEPKGWGAKGFILIPGRDGLAYMRAGWQDMEYIGKAAWMPHQGSPDAV